MLLVGQNIKKKIQKIKRSLNSVFDMKDLRGAKRILGIEILRDRNKRTLFRNQK